MSMTKSIEVSRNGMAQIMVMGAATRLIQSLSSLIFKSLLDFSIVCLCHFLSNHGLSTLKQIIQCRCTLHGSTVTWEKLIGSTNNYVMSVHQSAKLIGLRYKNPLQYLKLGSKSCTG